MRASTVLAAHSSPEKNTAHPESQQVHGRYKARSPVVHAHEIMGRSFGIGHVTAVQQHQGNLRAFESASDAAVRGVFVAESTRGAQKRCPSLFVHERVDQCSASLAVSPAEAEALPQSKASGRANGVRIMPWQMGSKISVSPSSGMSSPKVRPVPRCCPSTCVPAPGLRVPGPCAASRAPPSPQ